MTDSVRLGIAGSGKIVPVALEAMSVVDGITPTAICVRPHSEQRGRQLADDFGIETLYLNYDDMLADPAIDAIYVAVVNTAHFDYTRRALRAGKAVICEKPFTFNAQELDELLALARLQDVVLFEAITSLHLPFVAALREAIKEIGDVKVFDASYCQYSSRYDEYLAGEVQPVFDPDLGGGALMDLNVYNIHLAVALMGEPHAVSYAANDGFNGADTSGVAVLQYPDSIAICTGAKDSVGREDVVISGTAGSIHLYGHAGVGGSVEVSLREGSSRTIEQPDQHRMTPEFGRFAQLVTAHDTSSARTLLKHSRAVMRVLDGARDSVAH